VLVTGATSGLGLAACEGFARLGADVLLVARDAQRGERARARVAEHSDGGSARLELCDLAQLSSVRELAGRIATGSSRLDVLVHNAATGVIRPALETDDRHWDWTMNANARALLQLTRTVAPQMPDGSSIVAISSLGSQRVLDNYILIGTSKAALESLVRYLAVELAPGIRVNAVSGGVVETGALEHFPNREEMRAAGRANPVGKMVTPEDIAGAVAFLCSADADMVRGQTLIVDGGFSLQA